MVNTDYYGTKVAKVYAGGKRLQVAQSSSGMAYLCNRYLNKCFMAVVVKQPEVLL